MTSRAAFRRASAEVCSAAGIIANYTVTILLEVKQGAEDSLCLLTAVFASPCLEVATPNPTRAVLSRDYEVLGNCPSRSGSESSEVSPHHEFCHITIVMTQDDLLVLKYSTKELHNGGLRAIYDLVGSSHCHQTI